MSRDFLKGINKLQKNLSEMPKSEEVKLSDLMNPEFMKKCSEFSSLQELFDASPFKIESKEDFSAIPDNEWDVFISANTSYESWVEMNRSAALIRAKEAMFKGVK